ncbi:MAG: SDR family oxidoreductase [Bacteroidales bacterium]|nr:SDR family oxidoreductase [Bacteroidales bacterium]
MRVLLTGATGYIARNLLPTLLEAGHEVYCCVRDKTRFDTTRYSSDKLKVVEVNFLRKETLAAIPSDIDAAYYLIHSMSSSIGDFDLLEKESAANFAERLSQTTVRQVIYLSGIVNNDTLSKHLASRKAVEEILGTGRYHLTTLRAGIILGSGSASFEIIRDLVEKLPVMITPEWLNTRCQPIAIQNVIQYLNGVLGNEKTFDQSFDIGGTEILSYKEMLLGFARVRGLRRRIFVVPVMTPKLSSYWLYFITSTSYKLAVNLVNSMKVEVVCGVNNLHSILPINLTGYEDAIRAAFETTERQELVSSWTDALSSRTLENGIGSVLMVPVFGCYFDKREVKISDEDAVLGKIWAIGGKTGWYYGNWLWRLRGFIDKLFGGVGLRRGRRSMSEISPGDALDFWRVLYASKDEKRLLLYAEMKLPGDAWLEFRISDNKLCQTATFRPLGLWGRLYWYSVWPLHALVFRGMIRNIAKPYFSPERFSAV